MKFDPQALDDLARKLGEALPPQFRALQQDMEQNFRAVLQAGLAKLDLVTRQEFDVQAGVLARTREKLEAMEALWADLSRTPSQVPAPEWHREVLKARRESPATWLDWDQVKASLQEMADHDGGAQHDHRDP